LRRCLNRSPSAITFSNGLIFSGTMSSAVSSLFSALGIYKTSVRISGRVRRPLMPWLPGFKLEQRQVLLELLDYSLVRTR